MINSMRILGVLSVLVILSACASPSREEQIAKFYTESFTIMLDYQNKIRALGHRYFPKYKAVFDLEYEFQRISSEIDSIRFHFIVKKDASQFDLSKGIAGIRVTQWDKANDQKLPARYHALVKQRKAVLEKLKGIKEQSKFLREAIRDLRDKKPRPEVIDKQFTYRKKAFGQLKRLDDRIKRYAKREGVKPKKLAANKAPGIVAIDAGTLGVIVRNEVRFKVVDSYAVYNKDKNELYVHLLACQFNPDLLAKLDLEINFVKCFPASDQKYYQSPGAKLTFYLNSDASLKRMDFSSDLLGHQGTKTFYSYSWLQRHPVMDFKYEQGKSIQFKVDHHQKDQALYLKMTIDAKVQPMP